MTAINIDARMKAILASAKNIYVSGSSAEITEAPEFIRNHVPTKTTVTGLFSPIVNRLSYADAAAGIRVRSFFLNGQLKRHLAEGLVDYCPWRYTMIDRWMQAPARFDTAFIMMSPPDANGQCSLGIQTDFFPSFMDQVERVVGFINPQMPRTSGARNVDFGSLAAAIDYDVPLLGLVDKKTDPVAVKIAERIVELIPDGATLQFGIGQVPFQVIARLNNHKKLRVHSGIVDDGILQLDESGSLDRDHPIITGTAVGSPELYESTADARRYMFREVSFTHGFQSVSKIPRFYAVNSVLQVDLFGQVSAEASSGKLISAPGGSADFARGAVNGQGTSIITVRARTGEGFSPGIVPLLDAPHLATSPASDADVIVSEFGMAQVRDLTLDQRAEAIIGIADPAERDSLADKWANIRRGILGSR